MKTPIHNHCIEVARRDIYQEVVIDKKRREYNKEEKKYDFWTFYSEHLFTSENKKLNKLLGLNSINKSNNHLNFKGRK